jgi:hypothetical protein
MINNSYQLVYADLWKQFACHGSYQILANG